MYPPISTNPMSNNAPTAPPKPSSPLSHPPTLYSDGPTLTTGFTGNTLEDVRKGKTGGVVASHSLGKWSTGLCDCCSDFSSCCLTCWCPCITFGRIAEIVDRGSTSCGVSGALYALIMCVTGCSCMYSCFYRSKLRGQYFLKERPCNDCCVHCCFEECALCQEYRELQNQGFDMSLGWFGNMERQKRRIAPPPAVQDGMTR